MSFKYFNMGQGLSISILRCLITSMMPLADMSYYVVTLTANLRLQTDATTSVAKKSIDDVHDDVHDAR